MPPAKGGKESWATLTAPVDVSVVEAAKMELAAGPSRCSKPSPKPPAAAVAVPCRGRYRPSHQHRGRQPQRSHHTSHGEALALVTHHPPIHVGQGGRDQEDEEHLEQAGEDARVFKGMGRVGVEVTTTVGTQDLDRFLGGDRTTGNQLAGTGGRIGDLRGPEILHDAANHQGDGRHGGDGQQDAERGAGQVHPEVAQPVCSGPRNAANQGYHHHDSDGGGQEVLHGQQAHLDEDAHSGLRCIRLPVGVGDKGDGRVHGNPRVHPGKGIAAWQHGLQALKSEDHQDGYQ